MTADEMLEVYRKDRRRKTILKRACPDVMDMNTKDLYFTILDDVENAISRLEGDLYVSESSPEFKNLKSIYEKLIDIKFSIDNALG